MTVEVSRQSPPRPLVVAAILAAASLMMAVTGYSFMAGNHEVYLLEPLRRAGGATFEGDWFVTETLQYHGLYATIAAWLFRLDVARPAFLAIFLILLLTAAWAWWRIVRALGGDVTAYLVSVVLYHILLGDRGLGFYSLLQDGQFNAGNVAAVGLLVGIAIWIEGRIVWAGLMFGVAGAFHLNYAVVAPGVWVMLAAWHFFGRAKLLPSRCEGRMSSHEWLGGSLALPWAATVFALLPSLVNIGFALPSKLAERERMPLGRFVDLYVHLRHPHHYDPLAWPWWVWAAFLVPIPFAVLGWRKFNPSPSGRGAEHSEAVRGEHQAPPPEFSPGPSGHPLPEGEGVRRAWNEAAKIWVLLMGLQVFALVTAGVFWWGETFVQLSLWRFSPHAKLLAVTAASVWLVGVRCATGSTPNAERSKASDRARGEEPGQTSLQAHPSSFIPHPSEDPGLRFAQPSASGGELNGKAGSNRAPGGTVSPEGEVVSGKDEGHDLPFGSSRSTRRGARASLLFLLFGFTILFVSPLMMTPATNPNSMFSEEGPGLNLFFIGLAVISIGYVLVIHYGNAMLTGPRAMRRAPSAFMPLFAVMSMTLLVTAGWNDALAPPGQPTMDEEIRAAATWAHGNNAENALFLLPPDASAFSINARRGQVVSFKLVPQLSGELIEWDHRLREVLDVPDMSVYESGFTGYRDVQGRMRERYDELPSAHLFEVARKYGARYVFRSKEDEAVDESEATIAWRGADGAVVYALRE